MGQIYDKCLRCGRALKGEKSTSLGYGPTCYKRYLQDKKPTVKKLFNVTNCKDDIKK
jgi:hypothetical protein